MGTVIPVVLLVATVEFAALVSLRHARQVSRIERMGDQIRAIRVMSDGHSSSPQWHVGRSVAASIARSERAAERAGQSPAITPRSAGWRRMLDIQPAQTEDDMTLRFIGTTSDDGDCPTLYEIPETDEYLVQGDRETDLQHLVCLRDVKPSETFVRVPRSLLARYAPRTPAPELVLQG